MFFFNCRYHRGSIRQLNSQTILEQFEKKLIKEGYQLYEKIVQLKFEAADGKKYATDSAETSHLLRIIQSIPSPKAEPFKQWLSTVGYKRLQKTY